jgi:hypothetical protein
MRITAATAERILAVATLMNHAEQSEDLAELNRLFSKLEPQEMVLVFFARKMLGGKPYRLTTDNPDTVESWRSIACHLGASEHDFVSDGMMTIIFTPPGRH